MRTKEYTVTKFEDLYGEEEVKLDIEFMYLIENKKVGILRGYPTIWLNGKNRRLHQLVLPNNNPDVEVDHINGNKLDNRKENLRLVSHAINLRNRKAYSLSGIKGVYFDKTVNRNKPYRAMLRGINGIKIDIGWFKTAEEAGEAVKEVIAERDKEWKTL